MDEIRDNYWRYFAEESDNNNNFPALRWEIYVREKWELIKRYLSLSVPHPKGSNVVWTCVKYHITNEKEQYKDIGLRGFNYTLFEEEASGRNIEVLYGCP